MERLGGEAREEEEGRLGPVFGRCPTYGRLDLVPIGCNHPRARSVNNWAVLCHFLLKDPPSSPCRRLPSDFLVRLTMVAWNLFNPPLAEAIRGRCCGQQVTAGCTHLHKQDGTGKRRTGGRQKEEKGWIEDPVGAEERDTL